MKALRRHAALLALALLGCGGTPSAGADRAASEGEPLFAGDPRGAALYEQYCALCHGAEGEGYAADDATRLRGQGLLRTATDDFLAVAIARGRRGTAMAAYSDQFGGPLDESQIDALVAHLRGWQRAPAIELPSTPIEGDPDRGAVVYEQHCQSCHGTLAAGGSAQSLNRWSFLSEASDAFLRYAIVHGRDHTPMPAFEGELAPQRIDDVVAFLRRFEEEPHAVPSHMEPPSLEEMAVIRHPDGPTPDFELREGRFVSAAQVRRALEDDARLILLDARPTSDWLIERLPGALPVPYYEVEPILEHLPEDGTWIVAYCGCPHAASGHVVDALREAGVEHTAVLDEGVYHWIDEGYPTESGPVSPGGEAPAD